MKVKHPVDFKKYENLWIYVNKDFKFKAKYEGWQPETENDLRQPLKNGKYTIFYKIRPYHVEQGYEMEWCEMVHESRVKPFKEKKEK